MKTNPIEQFMIDKGFEFSGESQRFYHENGENMPVIMDEWDAKFWYQSELRAKQDVIRLILTPHSIDMLTQHEVQAAKELRDDLQRACEESEEL